MHKIRPNSMETSNQTHPHTDIFLATPWLQLKFYIWLIVKHVSVAFEFNYTNYTTQTVL